MNRAASVRLLYCFHVSRPIADCGFIRVYELSQRAKSTIYASCRTFWLVRPHDPQILIHGYLFTFTLLGTTLSFQRNINHLSHLKKKAENRYPSSGAQRLSLGISSSPTPEEKAETNLRAKHM